MIKFKKKKSRIGMWIGFFCVLAIALAVSLIKVTNVTVTGSNRYTQEEIGQFLFQGKWAYNSLYCYIRNRFMDHETIPFVEDYKVVFESPTEIEVIVYEKSVVGYVTYMGSNMYFDKDGIVVESTNETLEGIPWITGLQFGNIILHKALPVSNAKIFEEILNLTQKLAINKISVDKIQYGNHETATLFIRDVEVKLGDSSDIDGKVGTLRDLLVSVPELFEKSGTLYLDTYDETNSSLAYSFKLK